LKNESVSEYLKQMVDKTEKGQFQMQQPAKTGHVDTK